MTSVVPIQHVTLALKQLLLDRMERGRDVTFSFGPPKGDDGVAGTPRVNLFLFQVSENPHLRHTVEAPQPPGVTARPPPLRWDLRYLLTTYGTAEFRGGGEEVPAESRAELEAQALLADAMQVLHRVGLLPLRTPRPGPPSERSPGAGSQDETLRVVPVPYDLEQLSGLWRALRIDFQRAAAFEVSGLRVLP